MKIAIDAGHGLNTAGKQTPDKEKEWSFNNKVVESAIAHLKNCENVEIIRLDDPTGSHDVPLRERTNKANKFKADILVSYHHNAIYGKWSNFTGGTETYTYNGNWKNAERLAKEVHGRVEKVYDIRDRGLKKANFHMLRESSMPAILVEGAFMDSTVDIKRMRNDSVLREAGQAIAEGIAAYGNLKKKPQSDKFYRVVTGSFQDKDNAESRVKALKKAGFDSFIDVYNK